MSKQTVSNEYVSAFCLEMSLLLHAGIGIEDGLEGRRLPGGLWWTAKKCWSS